MTTENIRAGNARLLNQALIESSPHPPAGGARVADSIRNGLTLFQLTRNGPRFGGGGSCAQLSFLNRFTEKLAIRVAVIGADRRVGLHQSIKCRAEIIGICVETDVVVAQLSEFGNVRADDAASGKSAFHHATAKTFAQRMHPGNFVLAVLCGHFAVRELS